MTITIDLSPDLEHRLRATAAASGIPAEEIVVGALSDSLKGKGLPENQAPHLSAKEAQLLIDINRGMSESQWRRYHDLIARRQNETLTQAESQELISLCDQLEELNVARLEKLVELAGLRGVSLDQLMNQLGIRRTSHG